jgi:hypothetical protein
MTLSSLDPAAGRALDEEALRQEAGFTLKFMKIKDRVMLSRTQ